VYFEGEYDGSKELFHPEQITAALLNSLKVIAEKGTLNL
jgi:hypothetical protein